MLQSLVILSNVTKMSWKSYRQWESLWGLCLMVSHRNRDAASLQMFACVNLAKKAQDIQL